MTDDGLKTFLNIAADHRLLTPFEEKALARRAQDGDVGSRHELVLCNIRLVVNIARYYRNRGLPFEDVIQEGIIGLNRASEKFDPARNIRFSTYATWWIRQACQRATAGSGASIHIPAQVATNRAKLREGLARSPGADAVALAEEYGLDVADVERALQAAEVVTSLDREQVSDDYTHTLLDTVPDHHAEHPHDYVGDDLTLPGGFDSAGLRAALDKMEREGPQSMRKVSDPARRAERGREQRLVIELRFGLNGHEPHSLEDIMEATGMSRGTVQTRQRDGLLDLRRHLDDVLDSSQK